MEFRREDFPAPLGPTIPQRELFSTRRLTSVRIWEDPREMDMDWRRRVAPRVFPIVQPEPSTLAEEDGVGLVVGSVVVVEWRGDILVIGMILLLEWWWWWFGTRNGEVPLRWWLLGVTKLYDCITLPLAIK